MLANYSIAITIISAGFICLIVWLFTELRRKSKIADELIQKYSGIVDIDSEIETKNVERDELTQDIELLRSSYLEKKDIFDRLQKEAAIYDEKIAFAELGVYEPHFDFNDSEAFKKVIAEVRALQKAMVSAKSATTSDSNWTVDGSQSKGQTMMNRQTRLTMRAFNNECEAAIANTRWNNVNAMEKRILRAAKAINDQNKSLKLEITETYLNLKLKELYLTHEYREQLKKEKDDRAELARAEREEKRLLAEAAAAEREEQKYQKMLEKARAEAGVDVNEIMQVKIAELEKALAEAHEKGERAKAMAQMTRSGYVYIISNIGSFGGDIVKIGLTRRLDPDDRVKELGDASVPFGFDTHAMIYSEKAPELETALHNEFADRRVNAANMRKEFFRVQLDEVENAVKRLAPEASFFSDREAQEWHETLARRKQMLQAQSQNQATQFPDKI